MQKTVYGSQMSQSPSGSDLMRLQGLSVTSQASQSVRGGYIKGLTDQKRVGGALNGSLILTRCDWGQAVREFAKIEKDEYVFFSYSAKLLFWQSVWERRLLYQVEFRFILKGIGE